MLDNSFVVCIMDIYFPCAMSSWLLRSNPNFWRAKAETIFTFFFFNQSNVL